MSAAASDVADLFAALGHPVRRSIVEQLSDGPMTLTELSAAGGSSIQAVAYHVDLLQDAGLITRTRDGRARPCALRAQRLEVATDWLNAQRRRWECRLDRLEGRLAQLDTEGRGP